jgi:AbrB family looped-hinge helix DNA binding protein
MASAEKLTIRISTKGQVILPESVRRNRQWQAGTRLVVEPKRSDEVFGALKVSGAHKTLEEMDAGVIAEAKRRYARD